VVSYSGLEVPVEILDFSPRWLAGGLAANFARVQILVTFYDGDPRLWLEAIQREETPGDEADVAFLETMQQRINSDDSLVDDLRRIVNEFASRVGSVA
jgi:hypothetical protein